MSLVIPTRRGILKPSGFPFVVQFDGLTAGTEIVDVPAEANYVTIEAVAGGGKGFATGSPFAGGGGTGGNWLRGWNYYLRGPGGNSHESGHLGNVTQISVIRPSLSGDNSLDVEVRAFAGVNLPSDKLMYRNPGVGSAFVDEDGNPIPTVTYGATPSSLWRGGVGEFPFSSTGGGGGGRGGPSSAGSNGGGGVGGNPGSGTVAGSASFVGLGSYTTYIVGKGGNSNSDGVFPGGGGGGQSVSGGTRGLAAAGVVYLFFSTAALTVT